MKRLFGLSPMIIAISLLSGGQNCAYANLLQECQDDPSILVQRTYQSLAAGGPCKPGVLKGSPGTVLLSGEGSEIWFQGRTLKMKSGKLIVMAGNQPVIVKLPLGELDIPAGNVSMIQVTTRGVHRLLNLSGDSQNFTFSVEGGSRRSSRASQRMGEEMSFINNSEQSSCIIRRAALTTGETVELLPNDGVEREPITVCLAKLNFAVALNQFNRMQMLDTEHLFDCKCKGSKLVSKRIAAVKKQIDFESKKTKLQTIGKPLKKVE